MRTAQSTLLEGSIGAASATGAAETEHRLRLPDGRTLACLELGDPAGQPVLYFHGYPGGAGPAWELTLIARPWDFRLEDVRMPVSLWQGLADQILPPAMARRLAALPRCEARYLQAEGHLSLVARHLGDVLASLRA